MDVNGGIRGEKLLDRGIQYERGKLWYGDSSAKYQAMIRSAVERAHGGEEGSLLDGILMDDRRRK